MRKIAFFLLWPLVWFYAPLTRRVRLVITYNKQIVLVKNAFGPGVWQLPGGGIKFGESTVAAGLREAEEELGLDLGTVNLVHDGFVLVQQFGLLMRYSYVHVELDSMTELVKNNELTAAEWHSLNALPKVSQEVTTGIKLVEKQG